MEILDAYFAALFYAFIIFLPSALIYAQIISMFYHLLNLWVWFIVLTVIILGYIQKRWWKKSLYLKHPSLDVNLDMIIWIHMAIWSILAIIFGLLFIYVFIPNWQI